MKRIKLLLVALATVSFTAFFACNGGQNDEAVDSTTVQPTEQPTEEPTPEETTDSTATMTDSTKAVSSESSTQEGE